MYYNINFQSIFFLFHIKIEFYRSRYKSIIYKVKIAYFIKAVLQWEYFIGLRNKYRRNYYTNYIHLHQVLIVPCPLCPTRVAINFLFLGFTAYSRVSHKK